MIGYKLRNGQKRLVLGLMSGTSCDGLDIALVEIGSGAIKCLSAKSYDYSPIQKQAILNYIQLNHSNVKTVSQLNFYLAQIWAELVQRFLKETAWQNKEIDLIGSHGQTVWHQPLAEPFIDRPLRSTLQIGDPSVLAQLVQIPVVGDFRVADMAAGGQGAPLIPYFDWLYFSRYGQNLLLVNIGGISNITFVADDGDLQKVLAFDCGPGNMLMDQAAQHYSGQPFDADGRMAKRGTFSKALFHFILARDSFVDLEPPKSTGREWYGSDFFRAVQKKALGLKLSGADVLHTLAYYTAYTIHENYRHFLAEKHAVQKVLIGGGGARNGFLMNYLKQLFNPVPVERVSTYGIEDDFKEAIGFAVLADATISGKASNVPSATGASRPALLGKICLP